MSDGEPDLENAARFASGWRAAPLRLRMLALAAGFAARRRAYPLFRLRASRGGLAASRRVFRRLGLGKFIRQGGGVRLSLNMPAIGSPPYRAMAARGGLNVTVAGTPLKDQIDFVILSVSSTCPLQCAHCYEKSSLGDGPGIPLDRLLGVVQEIQDAGASILILSGGEPMTRFEDVLAILDAADKDRTEIHLHTSGWSVTPEAAVRLRQAGLSAAAVGLDDVRPERHDALRGRRGAFRDAVSAVESLRRAGLFVYLNLCLSRELVRSGDLPAYMDMARKLGVGAVRWIEPRPTGGYAGRAASELFSEEDRKAVTELALRMNGRPEYRRYPGVFYEAYLEAPERFGCRMGGLSHLAIDGRGNVTPCIFLPVRMGNVREESFGSIYARMRRLVPRVPKEGCPSYAMADVLRDAARKSGGGPVPVEEILPAWNGLWETGSEIPTGR